LWKVRKFAVRDVILVVAMLNLIRILSYVMICDTLAVNTNISK
jgi:hypothetical protein